MGANRSRRSVTWGWLWRARRAPFPLYAIEGWPGRRFVVDQHHTDGGLRKLTAGFAADSADAADVRVTTTRRLPSREERMTRHLDPWLAAVVGEARGHRRIDLVADPEAMVDLASTWQPMPVPVDGEPVTFRVRCEDEAWVAYAYRSDHAVTVCAERAASLPPASLRLATVRDLAAFEQDAETRRRGWLGRHGHS